MLKGKRIYLKEVEMDDLDFIEKLENNPEHWLVSGTTAPYSKKNIEDFILNIQDISVDKQSRWIICLNSGDNRVGAIDLFEYDTELNRAGIGIIIETKFRNKGFASESINLLEDYAFKFLKLSQLWVNILDTNLASKKLFEKLRFQRKSTEKKWLSHDESWYNEHHYQLENSKISLV